MFIYVKPLMTSWITFAGVTWVLKYCIPIWFFPQNANKSRITVIYGAEILNTSILMQYVVMV